MLYDGNRNRILHQDGSSEFSVEAYCERLLKNELTDKDYCVKALDTELYEKYFGNQITVQQTPELGVNDRTHSDFDLEFVKRKIYQFSRFQGTDQEHQRIERELRFFEETDNILQLKKLIHLIGSFKEKNIIWGVGRGSSCASYIMYLLEVHDVDPLKHDIPFEELSKEGG